MKTTLLLLLTAMSCVAQTSQLTDKYFESGARWGYLLGKAKFSEGDLEYVTQCVLSGHMDWARTFIEERKFSDSTIKTASTQTNVQSYGQLVYLTNLTSYTLGTWNSPTIFTVVSNNIITVYSTNITIIVKRGLSPIISQTNGLWTVEFRKE